MILNGMPGIEKHLAGYPRFHARIGFPHEYPNLSAGEIPQLRERH